MRTPEPDPRLVGGASRARRAVLVLHGGRERSLLATSRRQLSYLRMVDFYRALRRRQQDCAVYLLRYRLRGWNAAGQGISDPVADARWALDSIRANIGRVPVALLGHSMGGRAAFAVADDDDVVGVCGLAPWLPAGEPLPGRLTGRRFVLAHGDHDTMTSAPLSEMYARRLRDAGGCVTRFELPSGRHAMLDHAGLWRRFAVATALGLVGDQELPVGVARGLSDSEAASLALPLAGFDRPPR